MMVLLPLRLVLKEAYQKYRTWLPISFSWRTIRRSRLACVFRDVTPAKWWALQTGHGGLSVAFHMVQYVPWNITVLRQKDAYLPKLVSGEWNWYHVFDRISRWSDLGIIRTKAEPNADGSYEFLARKSLSSLVKTTWPRTLSTSC